MPGMPRRGMPTTYPAPPFDPADSGLTGPNPFMPVPCSRVIFSSRVICWTTIVARSSGESFGFIHGKLDVGCDCAKNGAISARTVAQYGRNVLRRQRETGILACIGLVER